MKYYTSLKTSALGNLLLVANDTHLLGVYFADHEQAKIEDDWQRDPKQPVLRQASAELEEYLAGGRKTFSVLTDFEGTEFQREIWRQIARIPFGETITYSELARRAGAAKAIRAAGTATGRNPISLIIPCHRVVGKRGALGGYGGGLDRKRHLLKIEGKL